MFTLLFLLLMLVVFVALVRASTKRRRALLEDEEGWPESARRPGDLASAGPLPLSPLDLLFGGMLGGGVRSYELDPETGEWVETTDHQPEPEPERERTPEAAARTTAAGPGHRRAERLRRRPAAH